MAISDSSTPSPLCIFFKLVPSSKAIFTTSRAIEAGFHDATHPYHVKIGDWIREWRGIYRISIDSFWSGSVTLSGISEIIKRCVISTTH
jgi:hypothetical protein